MKSQDVSGGSIESPAVQTTAEPGLSPRPTGSRAGLLLAGAVLGGVVTMTLSWGLQKLHAPPTAAPAAQAFVAEGDSVRLTKGRVPLAFETKAVELGPPLPRQPATGRVQTIDASTALSFAPLEGRVVKVLVRVGDRVKEGDKLVLVQSQDLASLQRDRRAAELSIKTRKALVERLRLLVESRAASANDLMVAESELSEASLALSSASSRLRALAVRQEGETSYWLLAPRAGIVVQLEAVPGKQVGPTNERPVCTVANLEEVMVVGDVSKRDAATLAAGMDASITEPGAAEQAPLPGKIEAVSDLLDLERQTVPVRIRVKNDKFELRPNEFVEAVFAPRATDRLVTVPSEAVVSDGATSVVFVETEPGVLRRRAVKVGRQNRERTEILSGLGEGDRIVVRGALLLLNAIDVRG
jgi:membrane fusion protein, heavy metal efflux system